jgi:hypothetical protein
MSRGDGGVLGHLAAFLSGYTGVCMSPDISPEVLLAGCCPGASDRPIAKTSRNVAKRFCRRRYTIGRPDCATGFLDVPVAVRFLRRHEEYRLGLILVSIDETPQEGGKPQPVNNELFRRIGGHLTRQLRPNDLLAAISSTEMAILITDGSEAALSAIASRVAHSLEVRIRGLAGDAAGRLSIEMGFVSLEGDGSAPQTLLESARSRLSPIYSTQDSRVA